MLKSLVRKYARVPSPSHLHVCHFLKEQFQSSTHLARRLLRKTGLEFGKFILAKQITLTCYFIISQHALKADFLVYETVFFLFQIFQLRN